MDSLDVRARSDATLDAAGWVDEDHADEGRLAAIAARVWGARCAFARADFDGRGKGGISWLVWLVYEDEIRPAGMTRYATRLEALVVAAEEGLARG